MSARWGRKPSSVHRACTDCGKWTTHHSDKCKDCRAEVCKKCGGPRVMSTARSVKKPGLCSRCSFREVDRERTWDKGTMG